jgi:hypothetical protein
MRYNPIVSTISSFDGIDKSPFEPLRNPSAFAKIVLDGETITWPDFDADMASEFLYELDPESERLPTD